MNLIDKYPIRRFPITIVERVHWKPSMLYLLHFSLYKDIYRVDVVHANNFDLFVHSIYYIKNVMVDYNAFFIAILCNNKINNYYFIFFTARFQKPTASL